ncbi:phosphatase PAP2 family protein [Luteibaculum oceani]|uniref:Phosphatase PAP2 family protein n=1 Tax=Luteibaculum oceani TaxID=1294296 RepID=A0A5C6V1Z6_9FLAO|nr:phosphatase PAP2 family protein [Luteibaculum oceani]TXC78446.1 phosphatase PAP2 family protein [Luteibaculum oceani]
MIEWLISIDEKLLLAINGWQGGFLDGFFLFVTNKHNWLPLYLFLILFMWWERGWKKMLLFSVASILVVATADLVSVHLFKEVFQRLRPCHQEHLMGLVNTIGGKCGGQYGFVSSHASNHFALGIWFAFVFKTNFNFPRCPFIVWAFLIALSRVYLGVHFPGDVIVGGLVGAFIGGIYFGVFKKLGWV